MNIKIENEIITVYGENNEAVNSFHISTPDAFDVLSKIWIRSGWDNKYVYSFSWMGRPIIQLPEDIVRIQEVIWSLKPDVVIETGIAHGGSLVLYASILKALGHGRVIGIDIDIRKHNKIEIESHNLAPLITMIQGSSISDDVVEQVSKSLGSEEKRNIVILDSNHTKEHVLDELVKYSQFVSVGSYIVVCDGIMKDVVGAPRTSADWIDNNPLSAIEIFLSRNNNFVISEPTFPFNEGSITSRVTYWPSCYLKRVH